ncbi:Tn7-like element transposition protein TnsE [Bacillus tuaregi]|uniref:Tn7-like element transposition protein TnsE n=1 Tax=Bacillus tuaregi TaxID=1816695 RepID=UPI0008F96B5E|nr:Tn7-like element transposition protein TnsE [Bacillus tuaregi]
MGKQQVKIPWPFKQDEEAQLIWIGDPFRFENKMMINAYFRASGVTKKILLDWGTLPSLAIQHFYRNGVISTSKPPEGISEMDITIEPNSVKYFDKPWKIQGNTDLGTSRSFNFFFEGRRIILPLVEVIRSILAPNGFLLYRLFESNSFPQYFIETYGQSQIHLSFTAQYKLKYTSPGFIHQLVWLLTNGDIRQTFESLAFTWLQEGTFKFDWNFSQPITITACIKENKGFWTVLQIAKVKNKHIPIEHISISHPEIQEMEKTDEAKKYTYRNVSKKGDTEGFTLDEKMDGSTEDFELVQMNQQQHEYIRVPKIIREKGKTAKQRTREDENTKKYYGNDDAIRSTADIGGQQLARGLEHKMLHEIQAQGELQDFINVLKVLENYPQINAIRVIMDVLPEGLGERKFTRLSDRVTRRRYVIAKVYMMQGISFYIVEIEREGKSLSTLILSSAEVKDWDFIFIRLLENLVNDCGTWTSQSLNSIKRQGVKTIKSKHSLKGVKHRAEMLLKKLL